MKYKATKTFAGSITMKRGEIRELSADDAKSLLRAGYIEEVGGKNEAKAEAEPKAEEKEEAPKKAAKRVKKNV